MSETQIKQTTEQKWLCGCHVVDGVLAIACTQIAPQGEVSSAQHANARPFSRKCFRLAPQAVETPKVELSDPSVPLSSDHAFNNLGGGIEVSVVPDVQAPLTDDQVKNLRANLANVEIIDAPRPE
jgi:hypothetical protein